MIRPINVIDSIDLIEIALICLAKREVLIRQGKMQIQGTLTYLRNETLTHHVSWDHPIELTLRVFRVHTNGPTTSGQFKSLDVECIKNLDGTCPEIYLKPGN